MILNKKGVFNRCAVPELAVKYKSKMWEEEWSKFETVQDIPETESCLEDMITAREEGKKRKKEEIKIKAGKRRKKEIWCGNHGEIPWGEAGSSCNGKEKRKFLYEGSPKKKGGSRRMKQPLFLPLTENEMMAREYLVDLVRQAEGEMTWSSA